MLWFKGWLETRYRMAFSLVFIAIVLVVTHVAGTKPPPPGARPLEALSIMIQSFVVVLFSMLSGAGINTQPALQATKGLHGSTLFTLSLPVSRLRLLAIRSTMGWFAMAVLIALLCIGMGLIAPKNASLTISQMTEQAIALIACTTGFYYASVLLGTLLDDLWRVWGSMLVYGAFWLLGAYTPLPHSLDLIRAMGQGSPIIAHVMPWSAMAFSMGLAAALFIAAWKIAERREF